MADKPQINCDAARCTGCRLCMLACSWLNAKTHNPSQSYIRVDVDEKNFACRIFLDSQKCTGCLSCVRFCASGALQEIKAADAQVKGGAGNGPAA